MPWCVYIIECKDGKLYTGITNNPEHRIKAHNSGKGGRFTRCRVPVKLLYTENCPGRPSALRREAQIKRLKRAAKRALTQTKRPISHKI